LVLALTGTVILDFEQFLFFPRLASFEMGPSVQREEGLLLVTQLLIWGAGHIPEDHDPTCHHLENLMRHIFYIIGIFSNLENRVRTTTQAKKEAC
jgi:hypothetical protein